MFKSYYLLWLIAIITIFFALTFRASLGTPTNSDMFGSLKQHGRPFETSQERSRYALAKNLVDKKSLTLDDFAEIVLPDASFKDGHYLSVFPPGVSLIVAPAYWIGEKINQPVISSFAIPTLCTILSAIFILLIGRRMKWHESTSFIAAASFALATVAWNYSITLTAHPFSALCIIAGLFYTLRAKEGGFINHILVWMFYGVAILIDYPNAVLMLPVVTLLVINSFQLERRVDRKKVSRYFLNWKPAALMSSFIFFGFLVLLGLYNWKAFGSWSEIGHNYRVTSIVSSVYSYDFSLAKVLNFENVQTGLYTLLFSRERGLIFYCPILLFSFFGIYEAWSKNTRLFYTILSAFILNLFVYAAFYDPWGGWSYGPRYLISTIPLIVLMIGFGFEKYGKRNSYILPFSVLFFLSAAIALLGAATTNLIPPSAEIGHEYSLIHWIPSLLSESHGGLIFNFIKNHLPSITLEQYIYFVFELFLALLLPFFVLRILSNFREFWIVRWKLFRTVKIKEANAAK